MYGVFNDEKIPFQHDDEHDWLKSVPLETFSQSLPPSTFSLLR